MPFPIAILASGNGTNAQAMIDAMHAGLLDVTITLIATNSKTAYVRTRAETAKIPLLVLDNKDFPCREDYEEALLGHVLTSGAKAVILAGYMLLLTKTFLTGFPGPVLNLHPALLPSFPGLHGAKDALNYGVPITGATVHFVDEKMDHGPIIIQAAVPVRANDTEESLLARIHELEHRIYPQAIQWLATGRLTCDGRRVSVREDPSKHAQTLPSAFVWPPLEDGF